MSTITPAPSPQATTRITSKVTPFLSFDGVAEAAARFYVSLLPDSRIDRIIHSPMDTPGGAAGTPAGSARPWRGGCTGP